MKTWYIIPAILICTLATTLTGCGNGVDTTGTSDATGVPVGGTKYPIISPPPIPLPPDSSIPSNSQAVGGATRLTVSWGPADGAVSYNIYWSTATGVTRAGNTITGVASPYVQSGLTANTTYYYIVVPLFEGGEGLPSVEFAGTTSPQ
jgi:hypothetical protein